MGAKKGDEQTTSKDKTIASQNGINKKGGAIEKTDVQRERTRFDNPPGK
jgi:hypothetical protein